SGDGWYTTCLSKNFQGISGEEVIIRPEFFYLSRPVNYLMQEEGWHKKPYSHQSNKLFLVYVSIPSLFVDEAKGYRHKVAYDAAKEVKQLRKTILFDDLKKKTYFIFTERCC
ncbi:hypothetical protein ACJX0J_024456, partial [Zea mays]